MDKTRAGVAIAVMVAMAACGGGSSESTDGTDSNANSATTTALTAPELDVTMPDEEPEISSFEVIEVGAGETVGVGDLIYAAWEMAAISTGEVVESTADDFGGPVPIEIGAGFVPAALDEALTGQTVGTQLEVRFPAGMADLPDYLDADEAYVLAVQIVERAERLANEPPPTTSAPSTGAGDEPSIDPGLFVPAAGRLSATPPAGADLPDRNSSAVVSRGDGAILAEGDTVELDYVVVSWTTGAEVLSTADAFGGTQTIVLGEIEVPRILESAIFHQPVGSRVQVVYAPDLPDLHEGLSPDDAYVVAVDIVSAG